MERAPGGSAFGLIERAPRLLAWLGLALPYDYAHAYAYAYAYAYALAWLGLAWLGFGTIMLALTCR